MMILRYALAFLLLIAAANTTAYSASTVESLPAVGTGGSQFPLPDPASVTQHLWITQGASGDYKITPTQLGYIYQGATAPGTPVNYELWWDTSTSPVTLRLYSGSAWAAIGTFDTTNAVWTPPIGGGVTTTIAGSGTTDLGSVSQSAVTVTGSATITSFGSSAVVGTVKILTFSGASILTHNAASLILPGAANITTAAGDVGVFAYLGSGNWRAISISHAAVAPLSFIPLNPANNLSDVASVTASLNNLHGVAGPNSSTIGHIPLFNSTDGKLLSDGGLALGDLALSVNGTLTTPTITGGTITTPTITGGTLAAPTINGGTLTANSSNKNVGLIGTGNITTIEAYGGASTNDLTCATAPDNTAALNAAVADGNINIYFSGAPYCFKSRPTTFETPVSLIGVFGATVYLRDYNEINSATAALFTYGTSEVDEGGVFGGSINAVTGTSGGAAIAFISGVDKSSGFQIIRNVAVSYYGTGSWYSDLGADGSANTTAASLGWRDVVLDNVFLFNQAPGTLSASLKSVVNWSAPRLWANSGITITGTVGVPTNQLSIVGEILGELALDNTTQCHILANANTLILESTVDHCSFVGSVATGVAGINNNSMSTTIVADGQVMFSGGSLSLPLAEGQGTAFGDATNGLGLRGIGSAFDVGLINSAGGTALSIPHNTLDVTLFGGVSFTAAGFANCSSLSTVGGVLTCVP